MRSLWNKPRLRLVAALCVLASAPGCGVVSQRRFDDSRLRIQTLQAENTQLNDVVLNVRSQNRDMALRSVEDARRIRALEEANRRLEKSVMAYQDETKQMAALLDQLRSQVRMAATDAPAVSMRQRLEQMPALDPAVELNPDGDGFALSLPTERLFEPGTNALTPDATRWLDEIGTRLRSAASVDASPGWIVEIDAAGLGNKVRLASDDETDADASATWRANKLRERLLQASGLAAERIGIAKPSSQNLVEVERAVGRSIATLRIHRTPVGNRSEP